MKSGIHIALLRGINVGGKNKLPMKSLAAIFTRAGCQNVRTYIQSGNVVYQADPNLARKIPDLITRAIESEFGLTVPVVTRTATELDKVACSNPFLDEGKDPATLHVAFLAGRPAKSRASSLDPHRSPPDEFEIHGREIFLHCPNGIARTKLTNAYFDSRLGTTSTLRNWKTVLKLREMTRN